MPVRSGVCVRFSTSGRPLICPLQVSVLLNTKMVKTGIPRRRHRHRYGHSPGDPREEIACVGRKIVAVFGESVSVSVSASWNASLNGPSTLIRSPYIMLKHPSVVGWSVIGNAWLWRWWAWLRAVNNRRRPYPVDHTQRQVLRTYTVQRDGRLDVTASRGPTALADTCLFSLRTRSGSKDLGTRTMARPARGLASIAPPPPTKFSLSACNWVYGIKKLIITG